MALAQTPRTLRDPAGMAQHEVQRYTTLLTLLPAQVEKPPPSSPPKRLRARTQEPANVPPPGHGSGHQVK